MSVKAQRPKPVKTRAAVERYGAEWFRQNKRFLRMSHRQEDAINAAARALSGAGFAGAVIVVGYARPDLNQVFESHLSVQAGPYTALGLLSAAQRSIEAGLKFEHAT